MGAEPSSKRRGDGKKEYGGAVPRYNNRPPRAGLADDFIEPGCCPGARGPGSGTSLKPPQIITPPWTQTRF
ncbi:hypothetical protein KPH14_002875 [Odynerus spinipes]|uniref:Uncharacterized protein n=1 Tax=Odynerus spinipes TaxID=1348599 RepID=A0AAD9RWU4_9HYME|nr:hypothetical protein KPH14_002875 [Odynerus spinipes]